MQHAINLAQQHWWNCMPNPSVGAVLVYDGTIIGQGTTLHFGGNHAEVECINSVLTKHQNLISKSTLYVTLEPCCHFGKTAPCTNKIIENNIPRVVIGTKDIFNKVNGEGINILKNAGVEIIENVLQNACIESNKRFFVFHNYKIPFIILKWAQTKDGFIALFDKQKLAISTPSTNTEVHHWRSQEMGIFVGVNTILTDNPQLNVRHFEGKNPIRMVWDVENILQNKPYHILDQSQKTIVFNAYKSEVQSNIHWVQVASLKDILQYLFLQNMQSIIVEGGAKTLQQFIDQNLWHEARIITAKMIINNGYAAPILRNELLNKTTSIDTDTIQFFTNKTISLK